MEDIFPFSRSVEWIRDIASAGLEILMDPWTVVQAAILLAAFVVGRTLARWIRPLLHRHVFKWVGVWRETSAANAVERAVEPSLVLIIVWLCAGVLRQLTWPSHSYFLSVAASLLSAWIVIRLLSTFVRNAAVAKLIAFLAWTIAALNITGLLEPAASALDALALDFGELRISALTVIKGVIIGVILLWAATVVSRLLEARIKRIPDLSPSIQVLLGKVLKITLVAVAILVAIRSVGIDLTALALFSGAVGLGIGFGLQKVVSNLISGVILLLDKSIKPGDVIEVGETFGWISSLGARYASVVTRDGKEYLIPNEDLITHRVVNWSFSDKLVRLETPIGVAYDSDPNLVRRVLINAASEPKRVLKSPAPVCHLVGFGDSSLDFILRFWISDAENGITNVKGEVLLVAWNKLKSHGISIPYPHRQLVLSGPVRVEGVSEAAE